MISDLRATVASGLPTAVLDSGQQYVKQSKAGQLYVATEREWLINSGYAYRASLGTVTGEGAPTGATEAGGTDIDLDEPDMVISCPTGYFMVPLEVMAGALIPDLDADLETCDMLVCMDVSAALTLAELETGGTAGTLYNLLDGAGSAPGAYGYTCTTAVTNPTNEHILYFKNQTLHLTTSGGAVSDPNFYWKPDVLGKYAGPCQLTVYFGATATATWLASAVVAFVPSSVYPTS